MLTAPCCLTSQSVASDHTQRPNKDNSTNIATSTGVRPTTNHFFAEHFGREDTGTGGAASSLRVRRIVAKTVSVAATRCHSLSPAVYVCASTSAHAHSCSGNGGRNRSGMLRSLLGALLVALVSALVTVSHPAPACFRNSVGSTEGILSPISGFVVNRGGCRWTFAAAQQNDMQPFPTTPCDLPTYATAAASFRQWYAKGPMEISDCVYKYQPPATVAAYLLINITTACSNETFDVGSGGAQVCSFVFRRVFFENAAIVLGASSNHTLSAMPRVLVHFEDCVFHTTAKIKTIANSYFNLGAYFGLRASILFVMDGGYVSSPFTELNFTVTGCVFRTEYTRTAIGYPNFVPYDLMSSSAICFSSHSLFNSPQVPVMWMKNANITIAGNGFFVGSTHNRGLVGAVVFQGFRAQDSTVTVRNNSFAIRGELQQGAAHLVNGYFFVATTFVSFVGRRGLGPFQGVQFNGTVVEISNNVGSFSTKCVDSADNDPNLKQPLGTILVYVYRDITYGDKPNNVLRVANNTIYASILRNHVARLNNIHSTVQPLSSDIHGGLFSLYGRMGEDGAPSKRPPGTYRLQLIFEGNALNSTTTWISRGPSMASSSLVQFSLDTDANNLALQNADLVVINNVWSNLVEFGAYLDMADTPPAYRSMLLGMADFDIIENSTIVVAGNTVARNELRFPNASNIISGPLVRWHEIGFWGIAFFDSYRNPLSNRWGGLEQYPVTITLENNTMVAQIVTYLTGTPPFALSCALVLLSNGTANHATEVLQASGSGLRIAGNTFSLRADLHGAPYAASAPLPLLAGLLASPRLPRAVLVGNELTVSVDAPQLFGGTPRPLSPALAMWHLRTISTTDTTAYKPLGAKWHIEGNRVNFSTGAMPAGNNASDAVAIVQLGGAMVLNNASITIAGNALTFDSGANATGFAIVGGNASLIALTFLNGTRVVVGCETKRGWAGPAVEDPLRIVRPPPAEAWPFAPFGCGNTVRVRGLHVTNGGLWASAAGSQSVELANASHFSFAGNALTLEASASVSDVGGGSIGVFAVVPAAFDRVGPGTRLFIVRNTVEVLASNPFPTNGDVALVRVGTFTDSAGGTGATAASETWFVVCDNRAVLGPGVANQGRRSFATANGGGRHFVGIAFGAHTSLSAVTATRTHVELSRNVFALSGMSLPESFSTADPLSLTSADALPGGATLRLKHCANTLRPPEYPEPINASADAPSGFAASKDNCTEVLIEEEEEEESKEERERTATRTLRSRTHTDDGLTVSLSAASNSPLTPGASPTLTGLTHLTLSGGHKVTGTASDVPLATPSMPPQSSTIEAKSSPSPSLSADVLQTSSAAVPPTRTAGQGEKERPARTATVPHTATRTVTPPRLPSTLAPIKAPAQEVQERTGQIAGVVSVGIGAVAASAGGALGVANAFGRLVRCDDDEDDELPIMVHPLRFTFGPSVTSAVAAACLSNCFIIPFIIVGGARWPVAYIVRRYLSRPGTSEAQVLAALGWPSLVVLPFVPLGEGIGVVVVRALRYGEPLGICCGLLAAAAVAAVLGVWVRALLRDVPRRALAHEATGFSGARWLINPLYEWEPRRAGDMEGPAKALGDRQRRLSSALVAIGNGRRTSSSGPVVLRSRRVSSEPSRSLPLLLASSPTASEAPTWADGPPSPSPQPGGGFSPPASPTTAQRSRSQSEAPDEEAAERAARAATTALEVALLRSAHMLGEKRFYYAELVSFGCSLIVGAAEGLPGSACKPRVLIAVAAAIVQALANATSIVPVELALQTALGLCVVALALIAAVQVFGGTEASTGDLMDVLNAISNVVGLAATLFGMGRAAVDAYSSTSRRARAARIMSARAAEGALEMAMRAERLRDDGRDIDEEDRPPLADAVGESFDATPHAAPLIRAGVSMSSSSSSSELLLGGPPARPAPLPNDGADSDLDDLLPPSPPAAPQAAPPKQLTAAASRWGTVRRRVVRRRPTVARRAAGASDSDGGSGGEDAAPIVSGSPRRHGFGLFADESSSEDDFLGILPTTQLKTRLRGATQAIGAQPQQSPQQSPVPRPAHSQALELGTEESFAL